MLKKKPAKPTREQENIQKIMKALMLPVRTASYETLPKEEREKRERRDYEIFLKEEREKREKILPNEIERLEKKIRQLSSKDTKDAQDLKANIAKLAQAKEIAAASLKKSAAQVKKLESENISEVGLLQLENLAIDKNGLDMELLSKPQKEAEAEAKQRGQAFIKEKPKISMSTLKQIHDRKIFFADINDEGFKILQAKVNKIFEKHKNEPLANIVTLEESEEESEYEDVSLLLKQQKDILKNKIGRAEEKNKAAKDEAVKRKESPALQEARAQQRKAQEAYTEATKKLEEAELKQRVLPAVKLQKDLDTKKQELNPYVQYNRSSIEKKKNLANPAVEAAKSRQTQINEKNKLHQAIKANIAKQLRSRALKELDEQQQIIAKMENPTLKETLLKDLARKREKLDSTDAGLDCAVEYCIGQLEQRSPATQKALQKNCYKVGWHNARDDNKQKTDTLIYRTPQNIPLQMSEIHQLVYTAYVEEALKIDTTKKIPKVLPELATKQLEPILKSQENAQPPKPVAEKSTNLPAIDIPMRKRAATASLTTHTQQQAPTTQPTTRSRAITWLQTLTAHQAHDARTQNEAPKPKKDEPKPPHFV